VKKITKGYQGHVFHCFFQTPSLHGVHGYRSTLFSPPRRLQHHQQSTETATHGLEDRRKFVSSAWHHGLVTCPQKASADPGWTLDEQIATATPKDWYSNLTNFQLLRTSHRWRPETIQLLAPWAPSAIAWPCNALEGCQYLSPWRVPFCDQFGFWDNLQETLLFYRQI